jgi:hypothetical protein
MNLERWCLGLFLLVLGVSSGCATSPTHTGAILDCEPKGPARPICGFQNPEDMVALPGDEAILVSEYGAMDGKKPGRLTLFTLDSEERRVLFRGGDADGAESLWGDPACPGPPDAAFSPHGIHLSERSDGARQLLVVQHGGRESVEFFEVDGAGTEFSLAWRGCVVAPDRTWLNSVAAVPGGGFVTTSMMDRLSSEEDLAAAFTSGVATGYVVTWNSEQGYGRLPGSESAMPNGIEVSADGHFVFLNSSGAGEVQRIVRATGEVEAVARVSGLDNARWAPDGRLVVASVPGDGNEDFSICMDLEVGGCPIEFQIVAIDPETMETEVLYRNGGPPMGGGTVGLVIGDELFVGSFAGDRILRVSLD